jgi:hypothetical protein
MDGLTYLGMAGYYGAFEKQSAIQKISTKWLSILLWNHLAIISSLRRDLRLHDRAVYETYFSSIIPMMEPKIIFSCLLFLWFFVENISF